MNSQETVPRAEIARLRAEGVLDAAARQARLRPMLRARREFQNSAVGTNFYRLGDTYGLRTPESLFALCVEHGLPAAPDELRRFEADALAASTTLKRADDASAILWSKDGEPA